MRHLEISVHTMDTPLFLSIAGSVYSTIVYSAYIVNADSKIKCQTVNGMLNRVISDIEVVA